MIDKSKIKRFKLKDLAGRTLRVECFSNNDGTITMAFDLETNESFLLEYELPNNRTETEK